MFCLSSYQYDTLSLFPFDLFFDRLTHRSKNSRSRRTTLLTVSSIDPIRFSSSPLPGHIHAHREKKEPKASSRLKNCERNDKDISDGVPLSRSGREMIKLTTISTHDSIQPDAVEYSIPSRRTRNQLNQFSRNRCRCLERRKNVNIPL